MDGDAADGRQCSIRPQEPMQDNTDHWAVGTPHTTAEVVNELSSTRRTLNQLIKRHEILRQQGDLTHRRLADMNETLHELLGNSASRMEVDRVEYMCRDILTMVTLAFGSSPGAQARASLTLAHPPQTPSGGTQDDQSLADPWSSSCMRSLQEGARDAQQQQQQQPKCEQPSSSLQEFLEGTASVAAARSTTVPTSVPSTSAASPLEQFLPFESLSSQMTDMEGVELPAEYEVQTMNEDKGFTVRDMYEEWDEGYPHEDGRRGIPLKVVAEAAEKNKAYQPFGNTKHRRNHMSKWQRHRRIILAIHKTASAISKLEKDLPQEVCRALSVEYWEDVRLAMKGSLYSLREGLAKPTGRPVVKRRPPGGGRGGAAEGLGGNERMHRGNLTDGGRGAQRTKYVRPKNDRHIRIRERLVACAKPVAEFVEEAKEKGLVGRLLLVLDR